MITRFFRVDKAMALCYNPRRSHRGAHAGLAPCWEKKSPGPELQYRCLALQTLRVSR